jgi:long-chain fatty acid transport protein
MYTEYPTPAGFGLVNMLGGQGKLGVDLMQLIVAPTIAYQLTDRTAIGVSPLLVYQQFEAYGLQGFGIQNSAGNNIGTDNSSGFGVRVGYINKLSDSMSIGASYSPKVNMGRFKKYAGLFAEGGDFDIPANYSVGAAFQATPAVQIALDYQRIEYSGVASVANPSNRLFEGIPLGSPNGSGFGWKDINVIKLGVQWEMSPTLTLRAGFNRGDNPIRSDDVTFNILAPGVMEQHFTLGGTMKLSKTDEVSGFFMHAKKNSVTGLAIPQALGGPGGTETIEMSQNSLGLQYSKKF